MRKFVDEPDRVGKQSFRAAGKCDFAHCGFAGICVPDKRNKRNTVRLSAFAPQSALFFNFGQFGFKLENTPPYSPPVDFKLLFAGAARSDAAAQTRENLPLPDKAGKTVAHLRKLHL